MYRVRVLQTKVQVNVIFDKKFFIGSYWQLTTMLSILDFQYDMDNKTFMQSSEINIL